MRASWTAGDIDKKTQAALRHLPFADLSIIWIMQQPLRIALLNRLDVRDVGTLSGATYFMIEALERKSVSVASLGPIGSLWMKLGRYLNGAAQLAGCRYDWLHSIAGSRELGKKFAARLQNNHYDVIFAPLASTEIAYLETSIPIVYLTDMTFALGKSYYRSFTNLLPFTEREGATIERRAIGKAAEVVASSEWARRSFVDDYGCPPEHVHVVAFGANLDAPPSREEALQQRDLQICRLLLLGVNWERKGGALALGVLRALTQLGIAAELLVCGCTPPAGVSHPSMTVLHFLRKDRPEEARKLRRLLLTSTFLILPSLADAAPNVFAEASACGLPSVTRNTGGIASVVRDGINGLCLPAEAGAAEYAARIGELMRNRERYRSLCVSSRDEYEQRLNWDAWATRMVEIFSAAKGSAGHSAGRDGHA